MRPIDADRLLEERRIHTYYHLPNGDIAIPLIDIKNAPTIELDLSSYSDKLWRNAYERGRAEAQAEIVRCKDCKWKRGAECVRFAEIRVFPDDFCSRAERREDV